MKRVFAVVMLLAISVLVAAPANAVTYATQKDHISIRHYAPDAGYDKDLLLRCGTHGFIVREGHSTTEYRHLWMHPDCEGVTSIYVRSGEEWWRKVNGVWDKSWDATGWHNLPKGWTDDAGVTLRED